MIKGGFKYIDLQNKSLTTTKVDIAGVYDAIEGAYRKAIVLTNLVINGNEYHDLIAPMMVESDKYVFIYNVAKATKTITFSTIEINEDDEVKLSSFTCLSAE